MSLPNVLLKDDIGPSALIIKVPPAVIISLSLREWRNWQTRTVQVRVPVRAWGFKSPLAHQRMAPEYSGAIRLPGWRRIMMSMTSIRARNHEDCRAVVDWIPDADAFYLFTGPRLTWPLTPSQLNETAEAPGLSAWMLLDDDGKVVGHFDLRLNGKSARLGRVLIAPDDRGRGLAHDLVRHAGAKARELGATQLTLCVIKGNEPAIHTYVSAGFVFEESGDRSDQQEMSLRLQAG